MPMRRSVATAAAWANLRTLGTAVVLLCIALPRAAADADARIVKLDTRPGVSVSFWYAKRPDAVATVLLLTGGGGGIGLKNGVPTSTNFLVRSRELFRASGFNVAIVGKPTDVKDLDPVFRTSRAHMDDLRKVVEYLKQDAHLPVWLVGTSMGTISATAGAIDFGDAGLGGIVLTSSVTRFNIVGAVPKQKLEDIHVPVLVVHHEKDRCDACRPYEVSYIMKGLKNAPMKKLVLVNGGADPRGDVCEPLHWHGYIGMESEAVALIADWIKKPAP